MTDLQEVHVLRQQEKRPSVSPNGRASLPIPFSILHPPFSILHFLRLTSTLPPPLRQRPRPDIHHRREVDRRAGPAQG